MNTNFIFFGLIEIFFSIIVAVITFVLGFLFLALFTREYDDEKEIKENNIAVGILTASFLVCIGLALRVASGPAVSTLRNALAAGNVDVVKLLISSGLMLLHLFLGALISILSLFFTMILLKVLSPFKNLQAVGKNNIAMAIILGAAMFVTTLLISDPLLFFLEGFIPQVTLPNPGAM